MLPRRPQSAAPPPPPPPPPLSFDGGQLYTTPLPPTLLCDGGQLYTPPPPPPTPSGSRRRHGPTQSSSPPPHPPRRAPPPQLTSRPPLTRRKFISRPLSPTQGGSDRLEPVPLPPSRPQLAWRKVTSLPPPRRESDRFERVPLPPHADPSTGHSRRQRSSNIRLTTPPNPIPGPYLDQLLNRAGKLQNMSQIRTEEQMVATPPNPGPAQEDFVEEDAVAAHNLRAQEDLPATMATPPNTGPAREEFVEEDAVAAPKLRAQEDLPATMATPPNTGPAREEFVEEDAVAAPKLRRPATPRNPIPGPYLDEPLNRAVAERKLLNISQINRTEEDQPAPQQMVATPPTREELVEHAVASHKMRSEETDEAGNLVTIKASSPSSPPVYSLKPRRLHFEYFVRVDNGGSVHTYPTLTGPFKSRKDARDAINSQHAEQSKMMCMKGLSRMEIGIRRALYWHNGLRKNSAEALAFMDNLRPEDDLVRALLDKYNEDNNLSEDLVYELIKVVHCESIHERNGTSSSLFYHLNLVIRTKGADGRSNNLFFAEVACMEGKHEEFVLTFFCMLKPEDNGKCIECDADMRHPSDVEYHHGREKIPLPGGPEPDEGARAYLEELTAVYDEAELKAQEARVRKEFEELYGRGLSRVQKKYVVPARRQAQGVA